jgi:hypothetical protein
MIRYMYLLTPYHMPTATATTDAPSLVRLLLWSDTFNPEYVKASQSAYVGNMHFKVKSVCERLQVMLIPHS